MYDRDIEVYSLRLSIEPTEMSVETREFPLSGGHCVPDQVEEYAAL
jgi:hypothetical protein